MGYRFSQFLINANQCYRRQVRSAGVFRRVQPPQAQRLRLLVQPCALFRGQGRTLPGGLAFQNRGFQRRQMLAHESSHEILEHSMFLGQFEVHVRFLQSRFRTPEAGSYITAVSFVIVVAMPIIKVRVPPPYSA